MQLLLGNLTLDDLTEATALLPGDEILVNRGGGLLSLPTSLLSLGGDNTGLDPQAVRDLIFATLVDSNGDSFAYDASSGKLIISGSTPPVYVIRETFTSEAADAVIDHFETGGAFHGTFSVKKIGSTAFVRDSAGGLGTVPCPRGIQMDLDVRLDQDYGYKDLDYFHCHTDTSRYLLRITSRQSGDPQNASAVISLLRQDPGGSTTVPIDSVPLSFPRDVALSLRYRCSQDGAHHEIFVRRSDGYYRIGTWSDPSPLPEGETGFRRDQPDPDVWARGAFSVVAR